MIDKIAKILLRLNLPVLAKVLLSAKRYTSYDMTYQDAINYLGRIQKDPTNGCICNNNINAAYDLQIIIPVYNQEKYLRECIDSVISQETNYSYVITCVNDGSTDSSLEILEEYVKYSNFQIINQSNKGHSGARNAALNNIQGHYICFLDSDDRLAPGAIQSLMNAASKTDSAIVEGSFCYFQGGKILKTFTNKVSDNVKTLQGFPCMKVIKSDIFKNIHFPMGYWYEDSIMTLIVYPLCRQKKLKLSTVSVLVYEYRRNQNGVTLSSKRKPKCIDTIYVTMRLLEDGINLGLNFDGLLYEDFLKQVVINYKRVHNLGDPRAEYALFVITLKLLKDYFPQTKTQNVKIKALETALSEKSFKHYSVSCRILSLE